MSRLEQVFIGCPFTSGVRKTYDRLKLQLEAETPLRVVLADTTSITSTDYLLEHITDLIRESAGCIFDASGGNPNVSLEVGIAHALPVDFLITLNTRKPRAAAARSRARGRSSPDRARAIIADLQGRNRLEYKSYRTLKEQVVRRYLSALPYMKRWSEFQKSHKSYVPYALRVFQEIRNSGRTVRPRVDAIVGASGITTTALVGALSKHRLISVRRGRDGGYVYPGK